MNNQSDLKYLIKFDSKMYFLFEASMHPQQDVD